MMRTNLIFKRLRGKRILILGFGREGRSSLAFIRENLPDTVVGVADGNANVLAGLEESHDVKTYSGRNYLDAVNDYDIVLKTPGISLKDRDVDFSKITSQTDLFLEEFHDRVIGVTGTKGKSTTSSLIDHLLKESGRESFLVGNIGVPVFDVIDKLTQNSMIVFELSAHQLQFIHRSPHVGILLNVFEEHLDHFGTLDAYKNAKLNIVRKMGEGDWAVTRNELSFDLADSSAHIIDYEYYDFGVDWENIPLKGEHNRLNVNAALCACYACGIPVDELIPHLYTFRPLEHRQELVGTFGGVTFYNDSISTIPQAAIAAVETIKNVKFLLLGGYDREIDYSPLVEYLMNNKVEHLLFTGNAGKRMMSMLENTGYQGDMTTFANLPEAFSIIRKKAKQGDVCLLSPAAASYDQYRNFEERGRIFKELAEKF
ncbi:MAG: UDP-N-acetylmuramoyl-L-alanine--D-glutamate ligase [Bacteroidales bacterium]|nr:UDP-N-acetylmuramoyl-L-alanine--D-glutamate ligase [Bacteroidales bacterium]